ncbi:uncharacterized protein LOC136077735 [Hydra vulgaris]|uniref:Uncharacterized protein LOC136077735 n=1 Tax=Hydra vulgaris TaxID=6087 RepID=A0ABM4BG98_HYDVU
MEELSIAEFERLCDVEKKAYLVALIGSNSDISSNNSDGEDGDWVPNNMLELEVSDNDDNAYISDPQEIPMQKELDISAEEDKENEEEIEASQGENSDNERNDKSAVEAQKAESQSTYIAKGIV